MCTIFKIALLFNRMYSCNVRNQCSSKSGTGKVKVMGLINSQGMHELIKHVASVKCINVNAFINSIVCMSQGILCWSCHSIGFVYEWMHGQLVTGKLLVWVSVALEDIACLNENHKQPETMMLVQPVVWIWWQDYPFVLTADRECSWNISENSPFYSLEIIHSMFNLRLLQGDCHCNYTVSCFA